MKPASLRKSGEEDEVVDLPEFNAWSPDDPRHGGQWKPNDSAEMAVRQWFGTSFYPMPQTDHYTVEGMEGVYGTTPPPPGCQQGFKELALIERWLGVNDITTDIRLSGTAPRPRL